MSEGMNTGTSESSLSTLQGPRPARAEEREKLIAMINSIFRTSVGREPTIARDWAHVYAPENIANVVVVCDMGNADTEGGKLVASTGVWMCDVEIALNAKKSAKLRVGGINCVGTLPEYRRHGLGSQVMAAAHETMRSAGCHVGVLSTGINNWYRRLGWEEAGSVRNYRLNRGNIILLPELSQNLRVVIHKLPSDPTQNPNTNQTAFNIINDGLLRLHNNQRMGAVRSLEAFRQLAAARRIDLVAIAHVDGDEMPIAYLLLRGNEVLEWAGEWNDVLALVRATYDRLDDSAASTSLRQAEPGQMLLRRLILQTPGWSQPVTNYLDRIAIPYNGDYLGMLTVLDAQGVAAAYDLDEFDIKIEESEKSSSGEGESLFVVTHRQKRIELDRRQLTKLCFGPERIREIAHFPLPFWQWHLEMV